jgi:hypothetical protein
MDQIHDPPDIVWDILPDDVIDRPPGILTPEQRRLLLGEGDEELSKEAVRSRRYRIRRRVKEAVTDFLILNYLPDQDQKIVFEEYADATTIKQLEDAYSFDKIHGMLFLFSRNMERELFLEFLSEGVERRISVDHRRRGEHADVEVGFDISIETTSLDELKNRFDAREELAASELRSLFGSGRITLEEFEEYGSDLGGV